MSDGASHPIARVESVALIAIGGFAGSNLRYLAGFILPGMHATLLANAVGSFALGFILYERIYTGIMASQTRIAVATGFLSSFTTYSTFAVESALADPTWMVTNVVANYSLGFLGIMVGRELVRYTQRRWS
ncbi:MAG: CrcB family protein [Halodesulfurarchaeum sp.]